MRVAGSAQTVNVPLSVIQRLQQVLAELEKTISPYRPEFLARMYRARASDIEGRGKNLAEIKRRFKNT